MSNYFKYFPNVFYSFGNNEKFTLFKDLTPYIDYKTDLVDNKETYTYYTIKDGERPDILSRRFYGTTDYHWTFFLINEHLVESGWPVNYTDLYEKVKTDYPNRVIITEDPIVNYYSIGTKVLGEDENNNQIEGTIIGKNINYGYLIIQPDIEGSEFKDVGQIFLKDDPAKYIVSIREIEEYNSAHHFEDNDGNIVDIEPQQDGDNWVYKDSSITGYNKISILDYMIRENDKIKEIVVLDRRHIERVVTDYKKLLK